MADINLHDLSHDELTNLINEATNLRTTKFESQAPTDEEKLDSEMAEDPLAISPTALRR